MRNKVKKMLVSLTLIVAILLIGPCATRESAINDLENFSHELRDNNQYYTTKKWRKTVDKSDRVRREISRHDYAIVERQRIGKSEGDCARYMMRGARDGVMNSALGPGSEIQGVLGAIDIKGKE